jgi:hypothetical protein
MNKLLAFLIAGTFATAVAAQAPATTDKARIPVGGADAQTATQAAKQAQKDVAVSKTEPKVAKPQYKDPAVQSALQNSPAQGSATDNQAQAAKNVAASKAASPTREKMPNIKNMTPEQRAELRKQLEAMGN